MPMPLVVAHAADLHLGHRSGVKQAPDGRNARAVDIESAWRDTVTKIIEWNPHLVLIAGDIFDAPRPPWAAIAAFIDGVQLLRACGMEVAIIAGNHDTSTLRARSDVFDVIRAACADAMIASGDEQQFTTRRIDGRLVHLNLIASRKLRHEYPPTAPLQPDAINIMLVHGIASDIPGARHGIAPGDEQIADRLLARGYDYIAMGDWHKWGKIRPNAYYSGSIERFGWGDLPAEPGFLGVEIHQGEPWLHVQHIPVAARPMVDLGAIDVGLSPARAVAQQIQRECLRPENGIGPETMVRVRLTGAPNGALIAEVKRLCSRMREAWNLRVDGDAPDLAATLDETEHALPKLDPIVEFKAYVEARNLAEPFKGQLLAKGTRALEAAVEHQRERFASEE